MDTSLMLAGFGAAATAAGWAVRSYTQNQIGPLKQQIEAHAREDQIIHENVKQSLEDLKADTRLANEKLDRLIARR